MNLILSIPLEIRLAALFAVGICVGAAVNLAIYRLAWFPRAISPWSLPYSDAPARSVWDRLPVVGWLGLRREAVLHGRVFWIRPMFLELFCGAGLAWLYWWEVVAAGLLPAEMPRPLPVDLLTMLHLQFAVHGLLAAIMLAASMIDADEKIIPDAITVSGTLVGLLLAAVFPRSMLPAPEFTDLPGGAFNLTISNLHLASPNEWPASLDGFPTILSLILGLVCWLLWCAALLPRPWRPRHGCCRAMGICLSRIAREPVSYRILRMAAMGSLAVAIVWYRGGPGWHALLTALVGMAVSGGLVWMVRIVSSAVLRCEAMGFGDVTLMAMIGTYLGWQPCIVIFFLAPFAGLIIGVLRMILFRDREIPYGPFLCLATIFVIVRWNSVWNHTEAAFSLGWIVGLLLLGCLALMAAMLAGWRAIRGILDRQ